jgi:fermentation-respiration switch protein FrsA (DUF1100 family)
MLNLLLSLAGIFALIVIIGRLLHRYFIYIPDRARVAPNDAGLSGVEEVVFKAVDGTKLIAWYLPARKGNPTLLYFTGNSGNVASRAGKIRAIGGDGYGVFMLNYRRFGGSEGRPSEARIAIDAVSAYDTLRGLGVAPSDIVAYGESLGTAVAARLALQRHVEGLVLEAPFTSIVDVGRLLWKGFPLGLIMKDQYRTIDRIAQVTAPLFIVHGGRDAIIPLDQARHVFHAANEPKSFALVPQAGHNDLFDRGAWEKVRGFLESLRPVPVPAMAPLRGGGQLEIAAAASGEAR